MTIGIDEVGRGSIAGPLVIGLVGLNTKEKYLFKDSKKLTKLKRIKQYKYLIKNAKYYSIGYAWPDEIDLLGLTQAYKLAIERATQNINIHEHDFIIDGNVNYLASYPNSSCLVNGDNIDNNISAASVLAKVTRDNLLNAYSLCYPKYKFEKNVGYGTKEHFLAIQKFGLTKLHRLSFLKNSKI